MESEVLRVTHDISDILRRASRVLTNVRGEGTRDATQHDT